jgi:ferredoxin-nitrate reductase
MRYPHRRFEKAARYWAESKRVLSLWSMGINQSSEGTAESPHFNQFTPNDG